MLPDPPTIQMFPSGVPQIPVIREPAPVATGDQPLPL
jgi:hypothetical protein